MRPGCSIKQVILGIPDGANLELKRHQNSVRGPGNKPTCQLAAEASNRGAAVLLEINSTDGFTRNGRDCFLQPVSELELFVNVNANQHQDLQGLTDLLCLLALFLRLECPSRD